MPRKEKVLIGDTTREVEIPKDAFWGPETALALENFPQTPVEKSWDILEAVFLIKKAAAMVHRDLGALPKDTAEAIIQASDEALARELDRHFPLDAINSGAGTSLHMNVNEVLANRATAIIRKKRRGNRRVDSHAHVNFGQSTNDVIPTAIRIAIVKNASKLICRLVDLRETLKKKANEFWDIKTAGRTHMQDALPIRMGQRFSAYADRIDDTTNAVARSRFSMLRLGIGGTAIGSSANTLPDYRRRMIFALRELTGIHFGEHYNLFAAMSGMGEYALAAGALEATAIELSNIAHDFSLSSSGPNCGIGELILPAVQPGSSIMPGKVNPTICENLIMACRVISGNAAVVRHACCDTRWELNPSILIIGIKILESIRIMESATQMFRERCVEGIKADVKRCKNYYENSSAWPTFLNHVLEYGEAAALAEEISQRRQRSRKTVLRILLQLLKSRGMQITQESLERLALPRH